MLEADNKMQLTVSSASQNKITQFSILMGVITFIMNAGGWFIPYFFPLGTTLGLIPVYIVAITMGPIWGAIAGMIGASGGIVALLPVGGPLMFFSLPFVMIGGAIPGLLVGFGSVTGTI